MFCYAANTTNKVDRLSVISQFATTLNAGAPTTRCHYISLTTSTMGWELLKVQHSSATFGVVCLWVAHKLMNLPRSRYLTSCALDDDQDDLYYHKVYKEMVEFVAKCCGPVGRRRFPESRGSPRPIALPGIWEVLSPPRLVG